MPDPTAPAHYSFLPWFRRGIVNLAVAGSVSERDPVAVDLRLQARGEGEAPVEVQRPVQLVGPGQISGLDPRAIVRTLPRAGVRDFEANFLCGIEFYDEDFPWRYTPLLPAAGQLPPWLWLVVLADEEFVRLAPAGEALPAIEVSPNALATAFPDPGTTWAWAHTHLNFQVAGATPAESRQLVGDTLAQNPNLGCSRLLCPRRLRPATRYTAFLIPAFEKGRLAGLGQPEADIAAVANAAPSWSAGQQLFPVYYEWEFATQTVCDFESLALRLAPLSQAEAQALAQSQANRQMDIRRPGWGLAYEGPAGTLALESALRPIQQVPDPPITETSDPADQAFLQQMTDLLNLGTGTLTAGTAAGQSANPFFADSNLEDDPILVPPLYGSFYRGTPVAGGPAKGPVALNPAAPVNDWYNQLNLNPAWRVAASQGTAVVQQDQERYMDQAWDQLSRNYEAFRLVKRWDYSLEASQRLFQKRLAPVLAQALPEDTSEQAFLTIAFMAPLHQKLLLGQTSFTASVRQKPLPAAYSRSFTKVIRNGGPLMRRLNQQRGRGLFFEEPGVILAPKNILHSSVVNLIEYLKTADVIILISRRTGLQATSGPKDQFLKSQGFAGTDQVKGAFTALEPYLQILGIIFKRGPGNGSLYEAITAQIQPQATLTARLQALLPDGAAQPGLGPTAAPVFAEAMYAPLAARSTDFILPGLDRVPVNRVALLKTNPAFIEAYLVGLNHELSREYLWREFPAPLDTTAFSQFWDARDNPAAAANADISAIAGWGTSSLGTHAPAQKTAEKMVVLVRGDLLQKYPHTEIFLKQAGVQDGPVLYPLFSARIDPDLRFIGFDLSPEAALGSATDPGWLFVLKERAGEVHFGLDLEASDTDPSWEALADEVPEHSCLDVRSARFQALPRYTGARADQLAAMLYQKPFMLLAPAARLVPKD